MFHSLDKNPSTWICGIIKYPDRVYKLENLSSGLKLRLQIKAESNSGLLILIRSVSLKREKRGEESLKTWLGVI